MSITLPRAEREKLAYEIERAIAEGANVVHVVYEPGDMTHYELVLSRLDGAYRVGSTHSPEHGLSYLMTSDRWLLSTESWGAMTVDLSPGHYTDPTYVADKLRPGGHALALGSAVVLAELLCMVAGVDRETLTSMRDVHAPAFPEDER